MSEWNANCWSSAARLLWWSVGSMAATIQQAASSDSKNFVVQNVCASPLNK